MPYGDRPNFPLSNQRLDKVDVKAISDLKEEVLRRLWGEVMGFGYGLLSPTVLSWDAPNLTIGACRVGYCDADTLLGGAVRHDPSITPGTGVINLNPLGGGTGWIGFRRAELASDEENRAYWDALSGEKKVAPANTRIREYIQLYCHSSKSNVINKGFYPFLYVAGWDSGIPGVLQLFYNDAPNYTGATNGIHFKRLPTQPAVLPYTDIGEVAFTSDLGFNQAALNHAILATLNRYMDSDVEADTGWQYSDVTWNLQQAGSVGFKTPPPRGLVQLNALLENINERETVVAAFSANYDVGDDEYVADRATRIPGATVSISSEVIPGDSVQKLVCTLATIPTGWVITGISLTDHYTAVGGIVSGMTIPKKSVIISNNDFPYISNGTDLVIDVAFLQPFPDPDDWSFTTGNFTLLIYGQPV